MSSLFKCSKCPINVDIMRCGVINMSHIEVDDCYVMPYGFALIKDSKLYCPKCNPMSPAKVENSNTERSIDV
jgi:hypothetical protein